MICRKICRKLTDLDFALKVCKTRHFSFFGRLIVDVHGGWNIRVSHNLLNDFEIGFIFAETGTESVPEIVNRKVRK